MTLQIIMGNDNVGLVSRAGSEDVRSILSGVKGRNIKAPGAKRRPVIARLWKIS